MYAIFRFKNNEGKRKIDMDEAIKKEMKQRNKQLMKIVGKKLRLERNKALKSIEEVEEDGELGEKHLGKIERGEIIPLCITYFKICEAINVNGHDLFKEADEELKKREKRTSSDS